MENRMNDSESIRLTSLAACAGCAAKVDRDELAKVLRSLPHLSDPNVLQGFQTSDDAGVYRLNDELALVQTVDFFPPILDDPFHFGSIAAANSLSDVYAMGGKPLTALSVLGYPSNKLPTQIVEQILTGAIEKAREAGCPILGGHTINSEEPFFGLAVTGSVHPNKFVSNTGGGAGDVLVLTKPIGTGIITTAAKAGLIPNEILTRTIEIMCALNNKASEAMMKAGATACTDITGFGLLGHLHEICIGSGVGAELEFSSIPFIDPIVFEFAEQGITTRLTNFYSSKNYAIYDDALSETQRIAVCDPQTSGGLLVALPPKNFEFFMNEMAGCKFPVVQIGKLITGPKNKIILKK
jgi:selenium donor protein